MVNKTVIGDNAEDIVCEVRTQQKRADDADAALTMTQRRIRIFFNEINYVHFNEETVPAWAENWLTWLLIGEVPIPERPDVVDEAPADSVFEVEGDGVAIGEGPGDEASGD